MSRRFWETVAAPLRRARWAVASWSTWSPKSDRAFHDELFAGHAHDPLSPSYPGHLTIRRFADLAAAHIGDARTVVDLGCGPGEITCELARRHPGVQFVGLDHSGAAVARARELATRAGLANVRFEAGDLETYRPAGATDLVVMFDAFHHVLNPAAFVRRVADLCPRMFLIEPHGDWIGRWDKSSDLDWLPLTIQQIRHRLEYQLGVSGDAQVEGPVAAVPAGGVAHASAAAPTEHRYTLDDFERFFDGWHLDVRGTIAGLEQYGLRPTRKSPVGDRLGDVTYQLVVSIEELLTETGLDLAAKHWAIFADRTRPPQAMRDVRHLRHPASTQGLAPAYGVECVIVDCPRQVRRGERFVARLRLRNTGWLAWDSAAADAINASYHWQDAGGLMVVRDGLRTAFSSAVQQGATVDLELAVEAPPQAGAFVLAIDLVHEGVAWFSDHGVTPSTVPVSVES